MRRSIAPVIGLATLVVVLASCRKEERAGVPLTPVDISININNPAYADLQVPSGWLYLTGGSRGIVVYRSGADSFVAMDRHCPYQPAEQCRVFVLDDQVSLQDTTCCQSKFLITDGSVLQGPAALGLQRYNTSFNGTTLRIYN